MSLSDNPLATVVRFISINLLRFHSLTYLNVSVIRSLFEWLVMWRGDGVNCILIFGRPICLWISLSLFLYYLLIRTYFVSDYDTFPSFCIAAYSSFIVSYLFPDSVSLVIGSWCSPEELIWEWWITEVYILLRFQ